MAQAQTLEQLEEQERKLEEQRIKLQEQKNSLLQSKADEVYEQAYAMIQQYLNNFTQSQKNSFMNLFAEGQEAKKPKTKATPMYMLDGKPWAGRGRRSEETIKALEKFRHKAIPLNPTWRSENSKRAADYEANPKTGADFLEPQTDKKGQVGDKKVVKKNA